MSIVSDSKWIGILGSINSTPELDTYAVQCANKAFIQKNFIMFSDDPRGVAWAVLNFIVKQKVEPIQWTICTAIQEPPRNVSRLHGGACHSVRKFEDYQNRDYNIIDFADVTMCIWDGKDLAVKGAFDYAVTSKRPAFLVIYEQGKYKLENSL